MPIDAHPFMVEFTARFAPSLSAPRFPRIKYQTIDHKDGAATRHIFNRAPVAFRLFARNFPPWRKFSLPFVHQFLLLYTRSWIKWIKWFWNWNFTNIGRKFFQIINDTFYQTCLCFLSLFFLRKSRPLHDLNFETQNCLDPLLHVIERDREYRFNDSNGVTDSRLMAKVDRKGGHWLPR